ncbi:uncharacterized protein [Aegilops tauschii subsp. strangulata]|uniref:uncharacterized protein n=1 Tax=Aegilops tauschii subsp. strangulata TaxID=200361 RepID=UPI00098BBCAE|nr:uncharacterized protein LOC109751801 [Aegilops tauschii subsp. strangulata]
MTSSTCGSPRLVVLSPSLVIRLGSSSAGVPRWSSTSRTTIAYCTDMKGQAWRFQEHPFVLIIFLVCPTELCSLLALGQHKI